jgi:hypothetical protein
LLACLSLPLPGQSQAEGHKPSPPAFRFFTGSGLEIRSLIVHRSIDDIDYVFNTRVAPRIGLHLSPSWVLGLQAEYHSTRSSFLEWEPAYGLGLFGRKYLLKQAYYGSRPLKKRFLGRSELLVQIRPYVELGAWISNAYEDSALSLVRQERLSYAKLSSALGGNVQLWKGLSLDASLCSHFFLVPGAEHIWILPRLGLDWFFR